MDNFNTFVALLKGKSHTHKLYTTKQILFFLDQVFYIVYKWSLLIYEERASTD